MAILKLRVTVTAGVSGESKRDAEARSSPGTFPRSSRLLRHTDFERVYKLGRRHFSSSITVFYWQRSEPTGPKTTGAQSAMASGLRIGFTVGRALGGAVQRNR